MSVTFAPWRISVCGTIGATGGLGAVTANKRTPEDKTSMKKFLLTAAALAAVAATFMVITRVSAKQADETSQTPEVVRVTRREIDSGVKATGVIEPMVGAEVRLDRPSQG